jgi:multicomponent Na+:H+ antiporter subunit E
VSLFLLNILLAVVWAVVNGRFTGRELAVGFLLGYLVLWLVRPAMPGSAYHAVLPRLFRFTLWYAAEMVKSNWRIAADVLTRKLRNKPGIIAVPLRAGTDLEITVIANLISLTPGTLSLALSADRATLYVHTMGIAPDGVEALRAELQDVERRVREVSRGESPATEEAS